MWIKKRPLSRRFFLRCGAGGLGALVAPATAQMPPNPPVDVARPLSASVIDYEIYTGRFEAIERVERLRPIADRLGCSRTTVRRLLA